uniref:Uncharacterized protein n=1 Tax=Anguilla anguilla TaxID=7936 RepID=A0A0E9W5K2_ANGAN
MLGVAFYKLLTILCHHFFPIPPDKTGVTSISTGVRFMGLLARTHFFSSVHKFSMGFRSGLFGLSLCCL